MFSRPLILSFLLAASCAAPALAQSIPPYVSAAVSDAVKVPVISSTPHGLWHGVKLLGVPAKVLGFGMVMAKG